VRGLGANAESLWEQPIDGWYILAGERRVYDVEVAREACAGTRAIVVEVKAGEQTLTERLDVAAASCAP